MIRSTRPYQRWAVLTAAALVTASCAMRSVSSPAAGGSASRSGSATHGASAPAVRDSTSAAPVRPARGLVFGFIRITPTCPVDLVRHVCRLHALSYVEVQALAPTGRVAASARSQADGRFSLHLKPGNYVLTVMTQGRSPRCPRRPVSIRSARDIRADITCATGILVPGPNATNQA